MTLAEVHEWHCQIGTQIIWVLIKLILTSEARLCIVSCTLGQTVSFLKLFKLIFRAVIGEIDEEADANLDLSSIRADPLNAVVY